MKNCIKFNFLFYKKIIGDWNYQLVSKYINLEKSKYVYKMYN